MPFVDIHTHRREVLPGVVSVYSLRMGVECCRGLTGPFWAGVHPWDCGSADRETLDRLSLIGAAGIGEIGLDRVRGRLDEQYPWFEAQLSVAARRGLPVALHVVRASEEAIAAVRASKVEPSRVMVHGFAGGVGLLRRYLDEGFVVSAGWRSLASAKSREALAAVPSGRLLVETDGVGDIREVYAAVAEVRRCGVEELKESIYDTYTIFFRL